MMGTSLNNVIFAYLNFSENEKNKRNCTTGHNIFGMSILVHFIFVGPKQLVSPSIFHKQLQHTYLESVQILSHFENPKNISQSY